MILSFERPLFKIVIRLFDDHGDSFRSQFLIFFFISLTLFIHRLQFLFFSIKIKAPFQRLRFLIFRDIFRVTFYHFPQPLKNQNQNHFLIKDYPFTFTQKAHSPKTLYLNYLTNSVTKVIYIYICICIYF